MRIHLRLRPDSVDHDIATRVEEDVTHALNSIRTVGDHFIVNDTVWYGKRANGKITPSVMNMAGFISSRFQNSLRDECGWTKDAQLDNQEIDAFIELASNEKRLRIPSDITFVEFFHRHYAQNPTPDLRKGFLRFYHSFVRVGIRQQDEVGHEFRHFFQITGPSTTSVRIGLEFETGNIASSFRALGKLEMLFVNGQIDYGVFITSIDKENSAARIWPQSNRNGSFAELERRNYRNNLTVPLWEFGFEPDSFDRSAPYFNNEGTYQPIPTMRTVTYDGTTYDMFLRDSEELLRPINPQPHLDSDAT